MRPELTIVVMAGVVLSLFLIVGEIAAMRKRAQRVLAHFKILSAGGSFLRLAIEVCAIAALFLVQPFIIGILTALALDALHTDFSGHLMRQIRDLL